MVVFWVYCWSVANEQGHTVFCTNHTTCNVVNNGHDTVDEQNDECELDTDAEQDDEQELATDDEQDDEYELDADDEQNDEYESEERCESSCWVVSCGTLDDNCSRRTCVGYIISNKK